MLANLFLHHAFDQWITGTFPRVTFERYVDDAVLHCVSERQANQVLDAVTERMNEVGLELHPDKTKIVYCKEGKRQGSAEHTSFTFLGFTFRARPAKGQGGQIFTSFLPAISKQVLKVITARVRSWQLHHQTGLTLKDLAERINPIVRGWTRYYGAFYKTALYPLLRRINHYLMRWTRKKYRKVKTYKKFHRRWDQVTNQWPSLFEHWNWVNTIW